MAEVGRRYGQLFGPTQVVVAQPPLPMLPVAPYSLLQAVAVAVAATSVLPTLEVMAMLAEPAAD